MGRCPTSFLQDQFDIKEFVSSMSENLIAQSSQEPGRKFGLLVMVLVLY